LAYPFFSREIPDSSESDGGLSELEIYHSFMGAYPAYTIEGIETELSWRQVKELLGYWEEKPPASVAIARIESMLEKRFGITKIPMKMQSSDNDVMKAIEQIGWSA